MYIRREQSSVGIGGIPCLAPPAMSTGRGSLNAPPNVGLNSLPHHAALLSLSSLAADDLEAETRNTLPYTTLELKDNFFYLLLLCFLNLII